MISKTDKNIEDFVTFEQAKKLKELGFDWKCTHFYDYFDPDMLISAGRIVNEGGAAYALTVDKLSENFNLDDPDIFERASAPTLAQTQKWLMEKQKLFVISEVYFKNCMDGDYTNPEYEYIIVNFRDGGALRTESGSLFPQRLFTTYEQAISEGIDKALEILKEDEV